MDSASDFPLNHEPKQRRDSSSKWEPTPHSFDVFLKQLAPDRDEAGERYEMIRLKLLRFFEWRGCGSPDRYTDETLDRVIRRLDEGQVITNLMGYVYRVAHLVFLEVLKDRDRIVVLEDEGQLTAEPPAVDYSEDDPRLSCFDRCLEELSEENRNLIITYYQEKGRSKIEIRRRLAAQFSIPINALRIRAHRIRKGLEECIQNCLGQLA